MPSTIVSLHYAFEHTTTSSQPSTAIASTASTSDGAVTNLGRTFQAYCELKLVDEDGTEVVGTISGETRQLLQDAVNGLGQFLSAFGAALLTTTADVSLIPGSAVPTFLQLIINSSGVALSSSPQLLQNPAEQYKPKRVDSSVYPGRVTDTGGEIYLDTSMVQATSQNHPEAVEAYDKILHKMVDHQKNVQESVSQYGEGMA